MQQDAFDVIHSAQNMLHPSGCCGGMDIFVVDITLLAAIDSVGR